MEETLTQDAPLIAFVRSALWGTDLPEDVLARVRAMDARQWQALLDEARRQTVTGLLFQSLNRLPADIRVPEDTIFELVDRADRIFRRNGRIREAESHLLQQCAAAGLHPVVMKGSVCAARYPVPEYRESGDIDLFVPQGEMERAVAILAAGGSTATRSPDGSFCGQFEGIAIDLHTRYFDLFRDASQLPAVPSPEAELLMLAAHIFKHATGPGVGLRQICDFALADHAYAGDPDQLEAVFRAAGLGRWLSLLRSFVGAFLAPEPVPPTRASCRLLRIVADGGNFGHHDPNRKARLQGSVFLRKADTFRRMLRRLPFSFRYAPGLTLHRIFYYLCGNIR